MFSRLLFVGGVVALLLSACSSEDAEFAPVRPYTGVVVQTQDWIDGGEVALVGTVEEGGAAAKAGLRQADVIVRVDGKRVSNAEAFYRVVEHKRPGDLLAVEVDRYGDLSADAEDLPEPERLSLSLTLDEEPPPGAETLPIRWTDLRYEDQFRLGLELAPITQPLAGHYGIESPRGVLVRGALPRSLLEEAGIQDGDVIVSFGGWPIASLKDLQERIDVTPDDAPVIIGVRRGETRLRLTLSQLGPDLPGANFIPPEARRRLKRAIDSGHLSKDRLGVVRSDLRGSVPAPGDGPTYRYGTIRRLSVTELGLEIYASGEEWVVALDESTAIAGTGVTRLDQVEQGDFVQVFSEDGRRASRIISMVHPIQP